ncbi:MAG: anaerobic ribonucleoside-triphosphate reductase activating protein [Firmicutes bacterium]|nr:anaerobic ribonucleoside-triphosphate reductase activating protein [Bacillota bacterium]
MQICGFQKTSLVDFPGEVCSTVFVGRCNLRCRFCFNRDLVLHPETLPSYTEKEIFDLLKKRMHVQGALCITGGEPALQEDLIAFIAGAKEVGVKVKLDTNGTFPEVLEQLLKEGTLDYVAVDIKAPPEKYDLIAGRKVNYGKVEQTILLLKNSNVRYEFRTTAVPGLLEKQDLVRIAKILEGSPLYVLQQFKRNTVVLDENLPVKELQLYTREEMEEVASLCRAYVEAVLLRSF